jgi:hypothetical protein
MEALVNEVEAVETKEEIEALSLSDLALVGGGQGTFLL